MVGPGVESRRLRRRQVRPQAGNFLLEWIRKTALLSGMADFKTHISFSTGLGIAYGAMGYWQYDLPLGNCVIAGGLCGLSGMLPDLDSDSGVPIREIKLFTSAVIPMLLMERFQRMGMSHASMVLVGGMIYFFIRYFVWRMFKNYTKHRGMWHSVPAALIACLVAFLLCSNPDVTIRLYQSWAVLLGFLSHLFFDELYSVDLNGRRLKKSFGTALKFWGNDGWANYSTYVKLAIVTLLTVNDPILQESIESEDLPVPAYVRTAVQSLQFEAIRRWVPHDYATHQDFNQRSQLPIRRGAYGPRRRYSEAESQPTMIAEWFNYWAGRTRSDGQLPVQNQTPATSLPEFQPGPGTGGQEPVPGGPSPWRTADQPTGGSSFPIR